MNNIITKEFLLQVSVFLCKLVVFKKSGGLCYVAAYSSNIKFKFRMA